MGWGAEIAALVAEKAKVQLAISRVAAQDLPVPASGPLESRVLPGIEDIISAALRTSGRKPA
jgi:pyruvate/2-oxoglutarate/acetoin dehydrogenase E1 component